MLLELTIANRIEALAEIDEALETLFGRYGLAASARDEVRLVLEELLANLVEHAFPDGLEHRIELRLEYTEGTLAIAVEDDGVPFDPLGAPPPERAERLEDQPIGGFGLAIVGGLVDRWEHERVGDRNRVRLWMRLGER